MCSLPTPEPLTDAVRTEGQTVCHFLTLPYQNTARKNAIFLENLLIETFAVHWHHDLYPGPCACAGYSNNLGLHMCLFPRAFHPALLRGFTRLLISDMPSLLSIH